MSFSSMLIINKSIQNMLLRIVQIICCYCVNIFMYLNFERTVLKFNIIIIYINLSPRGYDWTGKRGEEIGGRNGSPILAKHQELKH